MSALTRIIEERFTEALPLLVSGDEMSIKLEPKPYLQPFERILAERELRALMGPEDQLAEEHGYWILQTRQPEAFFRDRLTYWQRLGRHTLAPTVQKSLEATQNGGDIRGLHRSRRLRYGPHNIHEYRGKFFPQLVRSLITISGTPDGGIVLDPMSGSGTTPCEAIAFGRSALAADLNPISVLTSKVKAAVPLQSPASFQERVHRWTETLPLPAVDPATMWCDDDLKYLRLWFDECAIIDLARLRIAIDNTANEFTRLFLRVALSNIVRSVSWQKVADLRVRKEVRSYVPGEAIRRFQRAVSEQYERIIAYLRVLPRPKHAPYLSVREGNAVQVDQLFNEFIGKVDLVVTSPPYATALPYLDTDRLSLIILGLLPRSAHRDREAMMIGTREVSEKQRRILWDRYEARKRELPSTVTSLIDYVAKHYHSGKSEVGFRRRNLPALLGKYFLDMLDTMRATRRLMRPGANAYYVVGNNSTEINGERTEIATDSLLFEIGQTAGWQAVEMIDMELLPSRDIFKENRGSKETILCFKA